MQILFFISFLKLVSEDNAKFIRKRLHFISTQPEIKGNMKCLKPNTLCCILTKKSLWNVPSSISHPHATHQAKCTWGKVEDARSRHIILISSSRSPTTFKFKIQIVFVGSCFRLLGNISEHNTQRGSPLRTGFRGLGGS